MKTSCIRHPKEHPLIIVRRWQLEACDGHKAAAGLLSYFEYWHNLKLDQRRKNLRANDIAEIHSDPRTQDETLLQFHNEKELEQGLLLWSHNTISDGIKILDEKKYISIHRNPNARYKFDKTRYFLFQPHVVQEWIDRHYPTIDEVATTVEEDSPTPISLSFAAAHAFLGQPNSKNGEPPPKNGSTTPNFGGRSPNVGAPSPKAGSPSAGYGGSSTTITSDSTSETSTNKQQQDVDVDENSETSPAEAELMAQLMAWGVATGDMGHGAKRVAGARRLAREVPDICRAWLEWFSDLLEQMAEQEKPVISTGALLASCIRNASPMPALTARRLQEAHEAQQRAQQAAEVHQAAQTARAAQEAGAREREATEREAAARLHEAWNSLDEEAQARLDAQARSRMGVLGQAGRATAALEAMRRNLLREQLEALEAQAAAQGGEPVSGEPAHVAVHETPGHALSNSNLDGRRHEAARG